MYQNIHYINQRNGVYYYARRIPSDLKGLYSNQRIVISLRTKLKRVAVTSSSHLSHELESYWSSLRIKKLTKIYTNNQVEDATRSSGTLISEAKDHYIKLKGTNKSKSFVNVVTRNIGYAIKYLGDKDLTRYTTLDAAKLRDKLLDQGLSSSSVKRIFSTVKAVVGLIIKELGVGIPNPFLGVYIPNLNDKKERKPIPVEGIKKIQDACVVVDDDIRWILAIISDTGLRLAEAAGLKADDVVLDTEHPYLMVRPNNSRRLKTKQSERRVPLVGAALWGAKRALEETTNHQYISSQETNNTGGIGFRLVPYLNEVYSQ